MLKVGIKDEDKGWNDVLRSMDRLTRLGLRVARRDNSIASELKSLGDEIANDIQAAMWNFSDPKNAPRTIKNKGDIDNPWIHKEETVKAVEARVEDKGLGLNKNKLGRVQMRDSRGRFA